MSGVEIKTEQGGQAAEWELVLVIHNLTIDKPFGTQTLAVVPPADPRLQSYLDEVPVARRLLEFRDELDIPRAPACLMWRRDAPAGVKTNEAVVGFRNLLAVSALVSSAAAYANGVGNVSMMFSDLFAFYPYSLHGDGDYFVLDSGVAGGIVSKDKLRPRTTPGLPRPIFDRFPIDGELYGALLAAWVEHFEHARRTRRHDVLFRSLQMAVQAAAVPNRNRTTYYDVGTSVALWVSAMEVLAHPQKGRVDFEKVCDLLDGARWTLPRTRAKRFVLRRKTKNNPVGRVRLASWLYGELYGARNDFLHGNPIRGNRVHIKGRLEGHSLLTVAPLLYRMAVSSYLHIPAPERRDLYGLLFDSHREAEKALVACIGIRKDPMSEEYRRHRRAQRAGVKA